MTRFVTLSGLLAIASLPIATWAASVSLINLPTGASSCTYNLVSGNGDGDVSYTCATSSVPSAGTLSLAFAPGAATSIVTGSGSTSIQLRRTSATAFGGAASGTIGITGGCGLTPAGGAVSFADAEIRTDTYTVTAGSAAGGSTCAVTLTAVTGASVGTNRLDVGITTTPSPSPSGCSDYLGKTVKWTGSQLKIDPFANGTPVAIEIDTQNYPLLSSSVSYLLGGSLPSGNLSVPEGIQTGISLCPGDFTGPVTYKSNACGELASPSSSAIFNLQVAIDRTLTRTELYSTCLLPKTEKFYLNLRLVKTDGSGAGSCPTSNCPIWVNISR